MAACRACCCGPKGFTRLVGFWARRRRSGTPPPGTSSSAAGRCRRRRNTAPPPGATPDCCCFYAELHFDRKPPSRQEQLTDKQPRPNKKKKQWREMEIHEFCPSYEEALRLNPTDEAVSEEELRHSHCC
uniref:Uncharacterized protein n=1 Tax=Oryza nivara TaxID=4536 RepID=A0A0E0FGV4_ORYNI